jgi:hypothetical protein
MGKDAGDLLMSAFDVSELQLRATAALGAYRGYLQSRGIRFKEGGRGREGTAQELRRAEEAGRDMAARTQAEYTRHMGGLMFGTLTGKASFQFGRVGMHYLDLLQLSIRAAVPGQLGARAREMMPSHHYKDPQHVRIVQAVLLMGGMVGMTSALNQIGIHISDIAGPGGSIPEFAKLPVDLAMKGIQAIFGDENKEREQAETRRTVHKFMGTTTREKSPWHAFVKSMGPPPGQAFDTVEWVTSFGDPVRHKEASRRFVQSFKTVFPGLQASRVLRFMEDRKRRGIYSQVAGDLMVDNVNRFEIVTRLLGFTPATVQQEYDELFAVTEDEQLYNTLSGQLKDNYFQHIDDGTNREEAIAEYMTDYSNLLAQWGRYMSWTDMANRAKSLDKEYFRERQFTRRQRKEDKFPFREKK